MNRKLPIVIASIFGSFLVYCVQSPHGFEGPVTDAHAETACCTPPAPKLVVLASGTFTTSGATSDPIPVGAYREVVVYTDGNFVCASSAMNLEYAQFRADASAAFGDTGQAIPHGGRVRVDGADMRLQVATSSYTNCSGQLHYTVAGVQ
jgi:hypothetical protein